MSIPRRVASLLFLTLFTLQSCQAIPRYFKDDRPNFLIIITDDQRFDTMEYMPNTQSLIFDQGVTFSSGYITTPFCCPSRASILTGMYAHNHNVHVNEDQLEFTTVVEDLHKNGWNIIGTSYNDMDIAEDRGRFSDLLKDLHIPYPQYGVARNVDEALEVAKFIPYPLLVRPSYVLGGPRMKIVINDNELERHVLSIFKHMPDNRVLIDQFLERASEAEIDAIFDGDEVHIMGIMEHIEPAGIHSGDSSAMLPTYSLSQLAVQTMCDYAERVARALNIKGLINIQFAIKDDHVYVIEANPRASRTTPFIAKAYGVPYLNIATKVMLGTHKLKDFNIEKKLDGYAIKIPVFSFDKFPNVDKRLGPEMKSTGEAIYFIKDLKDPYFRELERNRSMFLYN